MSLSLRQWLILLVLIVGFAVAALVVRNEGANETTLPPIDEAAWCAGAEGLIGAGDLLDGQRDDASAADFDAVKEAVYGVEVEAPWALRRGLGRIADFSIVAGQKFDAFTWPDAYTAARDQVDTVIVDQAIEDLRNEMTRCGHNLGG